MQTAERKKERKKKKRKRKTKQKTNKRNPDVRGGARARVSTCMLSMSVVSAVCMYR